MTQPRSESASDFKPGCAFWLLPRINAFLFWGGILGLVWQKPKWLLPVFGWVSPSLLPVVVLVVPVLLLLTGWALVRMQQGKIGNFITLTALWVASDLVLITLLL